MANEENPSGSNPYMPQFISQAPWYLGNFQGSLKHQQSAPHKSKPDITTWYPKGARLATPITKFRKGACTNCGALTHDVKTCCERPRKVAAKYSGRDLMQDEVVQELSLDWEGKRDRWNGYEAEMYSEVLEDWKGIEDEKVRRREAALATRSHGPEDEPLVDSEKFQEYDHSELTNNIDPRTKTTTRQLRGREDVPAYLNNLDTSAAMYDGKSRAMQECTAAPEAQPDESQMYRDSWMKVSGEMAAMAKQEDFAEQVNQRGAHLSTLANPSQTELMYREFEKKKKTIQTLKQKKLIEKYGGEEHFAVSDPTMQAEEGADEAAEGPVPQPIKRSKALAIEEDVYVNGHKAVWGSFYDRTTGLWGYACCHITNRGALCTKQ